ncbi:hypothetical protein HanPSC8_Chr14g0603951 [Helianthus annuus]|nr:hypothetical protein HanPSC8_Chr14g0603951 [Helianthus annuus]
MSGSVFESKLVKQSTGSFLVSRVKLGRFWSTIETTQALGDLGVPSS